MTAYGDDPSLHHVTREGDDAPTFTCSAPPESPCRTYPTCECEQWCCCAGDLGVHDPGEHCCTTTTKPGQPCWMGVHLDAFGVEDSGPSLYAGPDHQPLRPGWNAVTVEWDEGCSWEYADPAPASLGEVEPYLLADRRVSL